MTLLDEPSSWDLGQPKALRAALGHDLDPFTVVYRRSAKNRGNGRNRVVDTYHFDPNCPMLERARRVMKSRLGSVQAHGMKPCLLESHPENWNKPNREAYTLREAAATANRLRTAALHRITRGTTNA